MVIKKALLNPVKSITDNRDKAMCSVLIKEHHIKKIRGTEATNAAPPQRHVSKSFAGAIHIRRGEDLSNE